MTDGQMAPVAPQDDPFGSEEEACVVHNHPVPPGEMWRYGVDRDYAEEQDIVNYMNCEAPDEEVLHVERIKNEYVLGRKYEVWDVTTDKDGWWVINNLTNLYLKRYFPSLDYTISFHIGLMARLGSREAKPDPELEPFEEISRRDEQAMFQWERAIEAEDFQAVGMLLRENLLSLVAVIRGRTELGAAFVRPKGSDFKEWSVVLLDHLCPGDINKELRTFMKTLSEKTWGLVNWVTHDRKANRHTSLIAAQTCSTLTGHFTQLVLVDRMDTTEQCPLCRSRNVRTHYDRDILPNGDYYRTCGKCDWNDHPSGLGSNRIA